MATDNPYLTNRQSANALPDAAAAGATSLDAAQGDASSKGSRLTGSAKAQQKVGEVVEGAQETVAPVIEGAQDKVGQVVEGAKQQTTTLLSARKDQAADTLYTVAHVLRQAGQQLREQDQAPVGQLADTAATRVESVSGYLHDRDVRQIVDDTEGFARQRPAVFVGGAVTLGLLAARFLKSSRRQQQAKAAQSASTALVPAASSTAVIPADTAPAAPAPAAPTPASAPNASGAPGSTTSATPATSATSATPGAVRVSSDQVTPATVAGASTLGAGTSPGAGNRAVEDDVRQAGGGAVGSTQRTTPRS